MLHINEILMLGQQRQRRISSVNARAIAARAKYVRKTDLRGGPRQL